MPVAVAGPTLPIPLFGNACGWQMGAAEAELQKQASTFLADAARIGSVRVLHPSRLARLSPEASRLDPNMELAAGFPYSLGHASVLARQIVQLLYPPNPMKGIITDLDETLWSGIVGEVGARAVSWSLSEHAQVHGLYQQELRHLSEIGVLVGIASKNETAVVEEALRRQDLYVPGTSFFPVKASWGPKSQAVREILEAWNIGPEGVVFVDDSPMELEEVRMAFPSMTCLLFPKGSPAKVLELLEQLGDLFGKAVVHPEDALRQSSIRANAQLKEAREQSAGSDFVRDLRGKLTFDARKTSANKRLLELINKTNQFNLNGVRITEGEWLRHVEEDGTFGVGFTSGGQIRAAGRNRSDSGAAAGRRGKSHQLGAELPGVFTQDRASHARLPVSTARRQDSPAVFSAHRAQRPAAGVPTVRGSGLRQAGRHRSAGGPVSGTQEGLPHEVRNIEDD